MEYNCTLQGMAKSWFLPTRRVWLRATNIAGNVEIIRLLCGFSRAELEVMPHLNMNIYSEVPPIFTRHTYLPLPGYCFTYMSSLRHSVPGCLLRGQNLPRCHTMVPVVHCSPYHLAKYCRHSLDSFQPLQDVDPPRFVVHVFVSRKIKDVTRDCRPNDSSERSTRKALVSLRRKRDTLPKDCEIVSCC